MAYYNPTMQQPGGYYQQQTQPSYQSSYPPQQQQGYPQPPPQGYGYGQPPPASPNPYSQHVNQQSAQYNQGYPPQQPYGALPQHQAHQYVAPSNPHPGQPPSQGQWGPTPQPNGYAWGTQVQAPPVQAPSVQPPPSHYEGPISQGAPVQPPYGAAPPSYHSPAHSQWPPTQLSYGYDDMPPGDVHDRDADRGADELRSAMKGFGTDEKRLIRVLAQRNPVQVHNIRQKFYLNHKRDLMADIKSETGGNFEKSLIAIVRGPLQNDVHNLHNATKGAGTTERMLNDVLLGRSNADINAIKRAYMKTFERNLVDAVGGDLSGKTKKHFLLVLEAKRNEDSMPVSPYDVDRDVQDLYAATSGFNTDEDLVFRVLTLRNDNQIRAIAQAFHQRHRSLHEVIKDKFNGHMEKALLAQLENGMDKYMYQARLLEESMAGAGTKDDLLIHRVIRSHWDPNNMANVKGAYRQRYGKELVKAIKSDTSGDYERLLVACCYD